MHDSDPVDQKTKLMPRVAKRQLADQIGVTRQTIDAIELGKYSPSLEVAFQIADAFAVPLDEVFQYGNSTRSRT